VTATFGEIHQITRRALQNAIVGITDLGLLQTELPIKLGGFGFRDPTKHHTCAYLASRCNAGILDKQSDAVQSDPHLKAMWDTIEEQFDDAAILAHVSDAHHRLALGVKVNEDNGEFELSQEAQVNWFTQPQRLISLRIDYTVLNDILVQTRATLPPQEADKQVAERITLLSPHAGGFLHARPNNSAAGQMEPWEWQTAVRLRLSMDTITHEGHTCTVCKRAPVDKRGRHALCACRHGGDKNRRHNNVCKVIQESLRYTGVQVRTEQHVAGLGRERHADLLVFRPNKSEVVDVAITYAGQTSQECRLVANQNRTTHFADSYSTNHKINLYKNDVEADGRYTFVPIVANHLGGWSTEAYKWLKQLSKDVGQKVADDMVLNSNRHSQTLFTRLSVTIQKANARMISLRRAPDQLNFQFNWLESDI